MYTQIEKREIRCFQISSKFSEEQKKYLTEIYSEFDKVFDIENMPNCYQVFVDNDLSLNQPQCSPLQKLELGIQILNIQLVLKESKAYPNLVYQHSHELTHAMFFNALGIDVQYGQPMEEAICTAMSLLFVKKYFPEELDSYITHTNSYEKYRKGVYIVKGAEYNIVKLKRMFDDYCDKYRKASEKLVG